MGGSIDPAFPSGRVPSAAEHAAWIEANEPQPMPDDFMPEITETDEMVAAHLHEGGLTLNLGFHKSPDAAVNARRLLQLRYSMWQAKELVRLGRADELGLDGGA